MVRMPPDLLTLAQAAKIAKLDAGTLRVQIHNGRLIGQKIGRDWFVTPKALQAYLDQRWERAKPKKKRGKP